MGGISEAWNDEDFQTHIHDHQPDRRWPDPQRVGPGLPGDRDSVARESFNRAIALDPTLASAYVGMGLVLETQGQMEEALGYYDRAISYDPSSEIAKRSRASLLAKMAK